MKSEEEKEQNTYGNSLALWNLKYEYGINKLSCRKSLGPFHNKKKNQFSFGIFSEGLMISVGKLRGQQDSVKQNNPSALFYPLAL